MHAQASPRAERGTTEEQDASAQRAVLSLVLTEHPTQLTASEIARETVQVEAERTIRELVGAGLLRCEGESVLPTRAAVYFDRLS